MTRALPFRIYLPPCYGKLENTRYPSLYLFHGLGADDSQWDDLGIDERADDLITSQQSLPFLIIMPHQVKGIDMESALIDILIPHIDRTYRARPDPWFRAIGGLSRGGGLALRIGLKHYDTFSTIGMHSPANPYSAPYIVNWVTAIPPYATPVIWIDIGDRDPLLKLTQELISLFSELNVTTEIQINPGDHDASYWSSQTGEYLRWYNDQWRTHMLSEAQQSELPTENQTLRDP
ncbi:MAG: hypothetical protein GTO14_06190 [Anaerolineales bacterium]|nr:hypothetical protein [Anaerolineales bacterium]